MGPWRAAGTGLGRKSLLRDLGRELELELVELELELELVELGLVELVASS